MRWTATIMTLILPAIMAFMSYTTPAGQVIPVWRAIWPVFGATNQLLAGLALLAVTVWLKRTGRSWRFVGFPMVFMVGMTLTATILLVFSGSTATAGPDRVGLPSGPGNPDGRRGLPGAREARCAPGEGGAPVRSEPPRHGCRGLTAHPHPY